MLQLGQITMRGPLAAGGLVTLLAAVLQAAIVDDVPVLDVDQVCRGIGPARFRQVLRLCPFWSEYQNFSARAN
jgi:hypothetical protein